MPNRYQQIDYIIDYVKPESIVEIGTWNGERAIAMAEAALKHSDHLHYWGFDLFEQGTPETDRAELNVKQHHKLADVTEKFKDFQKIHGGFSFDLIRGNTRTTLDQVANETKKCDFAFIDGGHSIETIAGDYRALNKCKTVLFDDFYSADENGACPELSKFGCNQLVATLPH